MILRCLLGRQDANLLWVSWVPERSPSEHDCSDMAAGDGNTLQNCKHEAPALYPQVFWIAGLLQKREALMRLQWKSSPACTSCVRTAGAAPFTTSEHHWDLLSFNQGAKGPLRMACPPGQRSWVFQNVPGDIHMHSILQERERDLEHAGNEWKWLPKAEYPTFVCCPSSSSNLHSGISSWKLHPGGKQ